MYKGRFHNELDKNGNISSKEHAVRALIKELDENGNLIQETFDTIS